MCRYLCAGHVHFLSVCVCVCVSVCVCAHADTLAYAHLPSPPHSFFPAASPPTPIPQAFCCLFLTPTHHAPVPLSPPLSLPPQAFCPVITMLLLFLFKLESPSVRLIAAVSAITTGVCLASYGELHLSLFGLAAMLTSVVSESVRLVLTQHLLVGRSFHALEGLCYICSASTFWLTLQASERHGVIIIIINRRSGINPIPPTVIDRD